MFTPAIKTAIRKALSRGVPFACFRFPGSTELRFLADDGRQSKPASDLVFEIGPWLEPYENRLVIRDMIPPQEFLKAEITPIPKPDADADFAQDQVQTKENYLEAVKAVISNCRRRNGKTVFSRIIAARNPDLDISDAAETLFDRFPDTFGFLYYHPSTGCWLGSTPEILLSADLVHGTFRTMALAGTRPTPSAANEESGSGEESGSRGRPDKHTVTQPWDEKNIRENNFVVNFFASCFKAIGLEYTISEPETVNYGKIQHICRHIGGRFNSLDPQAIKTIIDNINPTPALCGTPTDDAIRDITTYEKGSRRCYGGFIAVRTPDRFDAFVNLRSAQIATDGTGRSLLHAGGGITPDSVPADEFEESSAKAATLLSILSPKIPENSRIRNF